MPIFAFDLERSKEATIDTGCTKEEGLNSLPGVRFAVSLFQRFAAMQAAGGFLLLAATAAALAWANSPWADAYQDLWRLTLGVGIGNRTIGMSLHHLVNDGLMAIFFLLVGLEIKHEFLLGELQSARRAALPIAAAIGGMLAPAVIFAVLNAGKPTAPGWGIPMATDIAFSLGVLALLGKRVPPALKVFVAAFAIVDDLGAVLVIALFYTADISWAALGLAAAILVALAVGNRAGVRHPGFYTLLGLGLWAAFLASGVHATVAGVLLAMTIPSRARIDTNQFLSCGRDALGRFAAAGSTGPIVPIGEKHEAALDHLDMAIERVRTPMDRLEHALAPWVTFAIVPVFALANAGVGLSGDLARVVRDPLPLGIMLGLLVGKQVGVLGFAWLAVRLGLASLPTGVGWRHLYGAAWLGAIGFTMSLFIAGLAFSDAALVDESKLGILAASAVAGVVGFTILRFMPSVQRTPR